MVQQTEDTLMIPFELDHLSLYGHALFLDNCIYAWIDTDKHSFLHSLSLSTTTNISGMIKGTTYTTPVLCNNDVCNNLSKSLSTKLKHPVLMGMGQGIDQLVSEHIPEIVKAITTTHNNFISINK